MAEIIAGADETDAAHGSQQNSERAKNNLKTMRHSDIVNIIVNRECEDCMRYEVVRRPILNSSTFQSLG